LLMSLWWTTQKWEIWFQLKLAAWDVVKGFFHYKLQTLLSPSLRRVLTWWEWKVGLV
jgi:hypothetical protein